jgi:phosphoribosylformylglycinamidine synthase
MLMVLKPGKEAEAEAIFRKWGLDFAVVGKTTDDLRFRIFHNGDLKADLPIKELGDEAPLYDRPHVPSPKLPVIEAGSLKTNLSTGEALLNLIGSPELASKRWVYEQYDTLILGNSIQTPGGDAAVVRVLDGPKGLAMTSDVTPRYCEADPVEGGKQAVAEAWRNISAVGGLPLAVTDNLNFGNPERPDIMGQFVGCLDGIGQACRALDFPIVSGNVSLYNETNGRGILPTPTIGGVGLVDDVSVTASVAFKAEGETVMLVGGAGTWLGQSIWLAEILKREEGAPPPVDLAVEKRHGDFIRGQIRAGNLKTCHDISDGGLAVAVAEMALGRGIGADLSQAPQGSEPHAFWYGEDQARYVVTLPPAQVEAFAKAAAEAGVPVTALGTTGGDALILPEGRPILVSALSERHESFLPTLMGPARRAA